MIDNRIQELRKIAIFVGIILLWQILVSAGALNQAVFSSPIEVLSALNGSFNKVILDSLVSLGRVCVGFLIAIVLGIAVALGLYLNRISRKLILPIIDVLRPIPPVAWIPIAIMWFGVGSKPAFFLVSLGAFFPIFTNSFDAFHSVKSDYFHAARNLGASKFKIISRVLFPAALPQIITGIRIGLGVGWMTLITAELVGATSGLGYFIQLNRMLLQTENVVLGMIIIGALGYLMNRIMLLIEYKMTKWRHYVSS
jgi:NitT/TauT family transport system permease protein/sulfonate transport system permease protein